MQHARDLITTYLLANGVRDPRHLQMLERIWEAMRTLGQRKLSKPEQIVCTARLLRQARAGTDEPQQLRRQAIAILAVELEFAAITALPTLGRAKALCPAVLSDMHTTLTVHARTAQHNAGGHVAMWPCDHVTM